jgi:DNA-binding NarL/FixJ family response regulator
MSERLRIVVVDDHLLFRAGVRSELSSHSEIAGEAATPAEAVAVIATTKPDVVVLDVHLPDGGGVAVLDGLRSAGAETAVLALSVSDAADDVVPMIRAGALGYVTKTIEPAELVAAIDRVAASARTVESHVGAVLRKLQLSSPPRGDALGSGPGTDRRPRR